MSERLKYPPPDFQEWKNKPPFQCAIHMGKHSVSVYSDMDHFLPYFEGLGMDYIPSFPGWKTSRNPTTSECSIVYCPDPESAFYYDKEIKTLLATGKPEDYKSGQVLAYLGFWMMEAQRQTESMFTMHSSALAIEDNERDRIETLARELAGKNIRFLGIPRGITEDSVGDLIVSSDGIVFQYGRRMSDRKEQLALSWKKIDEIVQTSGDTPLILSATEILALTKNHQ